MSFVWAVCSALIFGTAGLLMKASQMRGGAMNHLLLGLYATGTLGFGVHAWLEFADSTWWSEPQVWLAGAIIGIGSAWGNLLFMKALEYGPASLTSPLTNMSIVLVISMSVLWYGEPLKTGEWIGILLLLLAVVLISMRREPLSIQEKKWFWLVAAAIVLFFFRNGGLKITSEAGLPNTPILFVGYLLSLAWFAVVVFIANGKRTRRHTNQGRRTAGVRSRRTGLLWGLASGICSYGGMQLYAFALESGKASIAAPIFAANGLVVAVGSLALFGERLKPVQWLALALLFAGLILVRL